MSNTKTVAYVEEVHGQLAVAGLNAFSAAQRAALAADDSRAFRSVCEILVSVICAGLAMMVFTVWWIVS